MLNPQSGQLLNPQTGQMLNPQSDSMLNFMLATLGLPQETQPPPFAASSAGAPFAASAAGMPFAASAANTPRAPEPPVQPLDSLTFEAVRSWILEQGGSERMSKIAQVFPGVKRAHLEGHFEFSRLQYADGNQWQVTIPGMPVATPELGKYSVYNQGVSAAKGKGKAPQQGPTMQEFTALMQGFSDAAGINPQMFQAMMQSTGVAGQTGSTGGKGGKQFTKSTGGKDEPPPVPLDESVLQQIVSHLEAAGGALPLGRVTQICMGVKGSQLKLHPDRFELGRVGQHGQYEVRLPGVQAGVAESLWNGQVVGEGTQFPPLEAAAIEQIKMLLEQEANRSLPLSRLVKAIPGLKRQQIEALTEDFEVSKIDKKKYLVHIRGFKFGGKGAAHLPQLVPPPSMVAPPTGAEFGTAGLVAPAFGATGLVSPAVDVAPMGQDVAPMGQDNVAPLGQEDSEPDAKRQKIE
eukprot:gnl/TRDRNA2_/TRDRNA2_163266_c0_seq2.p1 gnl/TRDRNA2_/TRDRNA2_163266_c0~~gnl/TRDRNA2_/TRDRNA2_163266_c0_seq2.p1  ORF type:complete len:490 (-),score=60.31 gnl/TRDRNA2_/TRDRNA2_163266_c0_seq2:93-1478(-)